MADVNETLNNHDRRLRQLETRTSSASSGAQGIQGTSGSSGTVGGVPYTFSTTITDADPGSGIIRYNNATIASVTSIFIDNLDGLGVSQTAWYDTWDDSTNLAVRGTITIQGSASGSTVMNMFNVTGAVTVASGYYKIPVAYVSGSLPADATSLVVRFSRTGNQGDKGGLRYAFSTNTSMADPGSGLIRFNNATFASITAIVIDDLDKNAVDVSAYIVSWDDSGTSLDRGTLEIKSNSNNGTQIALFKVTALTDNIGWTQLTVTPLSGSVPANADELVISFHRTGLQGTSGAAGSGGIGDVAFRTSNGSAASTQNIFDSANDSYTVTANKRYYFRGQINTTTAIVSSVPTSVTFSFTGTATLSDIILNYISYTTGGASIKYGQSTSTSTAIVGTSGAAQISTTNMEGTFDVGTGAGGTVIPQVSSSAPSTVSVQLGSWLTIVELGSDTATEFGSGGWA